jgi:hypothetical protein
MICPNCNRKIKGLTVAIISLGRAKLNKTDEIIVKDAQVINDVDCSACDIEYPRYYCGSCGQFITSNTNEAKRILEEADKK